MNGDTLPPKLPGRVATVQPGEAWRKDTIFIPQPGLYFFFLACERSDAIGTRSFFGVLGSRRSLCHFQN
jgi:hypothetical protein